MRTGDRFPGKAPLHTYTCMQQINIASSGVENQCAHTAAAARVRTPICTVRRGVHFHLHISQVEDLCAGIVCCAFCISAQCMGSEGIAAAPFVQHTRDADA
jgi:hypothetical protein